MIKPYGYWTFERCREEALKYKTRMEFKNNSGGAYTHCVKHQYLNDVCSHMNELRKLKGYWTFEHCKEETLKYKTKNEFNINSKGAYIKALKNKWLDKICSHMEILGSKYKRCIYSYEFPNNYVYVGLTFNINKRQSNRDSDNTDGVTRFIEKTGLKPVRKQLTEYIDVNDAVIMENYYLNFYKNNGWNILNKNKTGGIGSSKETKWDFNTVKNEALKYKTRTEFKEKSGGAYYAAIKNKWLDEVSSHMIIFSKPMNYWKSINSCKEEALKYNSKQNFYKNARGAYESSRKHGWLNDICVHMKK
jgi:ribosome-associated toxin RatA of RatAB toxin-antitoxin module